MSLTGHNVEKHVCVCGFATPWVGTWVTSPGTPCCCQLAEKHDCIDLCNSVYAEQLLSQKPLLSGFSLFGLLYRWGSVHAGKVFENKQL